MTDLFVGGGGGEGVFLETGIVRVRFIISTNIRLEYVIIVDRSIGNRGYHTRVCIPEVRFMINSFVLNEGSQTSNTIRRYLPANSSIKFLNIVGQSRDS